ncbi:uncharacterized protein [Rutidosis leptorrhynchoides]|uniref:uncharacterized protein isoform X2 n=1 Tax=Rutidosis leptorrhynchoides TaxID=125765 RepID=UPI003A9A5D15
MDSTDIKGIAWVGNIYQKFEAMCMEVEEAMCQDFLPPSSKDLTRVANAELSLNPYLEFGIHKKSISSIKEDAIDPVRIKGISEDKSKSSNDVWEDWSTASFDWEISDKDEANCDRMANEALKSKPKGEQELKMCNQIVNTSHGSPAPSTAVSTKSSLKVVKRPRRIPTSNITIAERTDKSESRGPVSQMGSQATSETSNCLSINGDATHIDPCENNRCVSSSQTDSHISSSTQSGESVIEEAFRSHTGSSADCAPDIIGDNNPSVRMMELIGHDSEESGFEETCVLVDNSDYCLDNHNKEIKRSYKKKIRNVFSLKKNSARKQEYKQVAVQYGNAEPNIQGKTSVPLATATSENIKAKNLSTLDSLDSEWELL